MKTTIANVPARNNLGGLQAQSTLTSLDRSTTRKSVPSPQRNKHSLGRVVTREATGRHDRDQFINFPWCIYALSLPTFLPRQQNLWVASGSGRFPSW